MGFESLRETESIGFFKNNNVAVPSGVHSSNVTGGKTQPTIETNHLQHTGVGKAVASDVLEVYLPNSYNA